MLVAKGEHHNLCRPNHTICLQLNHISYVHPDIKSYQSVKCLLLLPLLLPLPFAPLPSPPSCCPPPHLPLQVVPSPSSPPHYPLPVSSPLSQSCLPLSTPLLLVHPPASLFLPTPGPCQLFSHLFY